MSRAPRLRDNTAPSERQPYGAPPVFFFLRDHKLMFVRYLTQRTSVFLIKCTGDQTFLPILYFLLLISSDSPACFACGYMKALTRVLRIRSPLGLSTLLAKKGKNDDHTFAFGVLSEKQCGCWGLIVTLELLLL